jgi:hypothetical protein
LVRTGRHRVIKRLGEGQVGVVVNLCERESDKKQLAIKKFNVFLEDEEPDEKARNRKNT